jgi:hypothetical protein
MRDPRCVLRFLGSLLGGCRFLLRDTRLFSEPLGMSAFRCGEVTRALGRGVLLLDSQLGRLSLSAVVIERCASDRSLPARRLRVAPQRREHRGKFGCIVIGSCEGTES